jgi:CRP-like cAMP-binding protein
MDDASGAEGLRDRLARQGEDTLGRLAQDLLENPLVNSAISKAFGARERAGQAQEAALGALNIPSAADVERLTRRLRSVSQRLEGIEDGVDRLDQRLASLPRADAEPPARLDERLGAIESQLGKLAMELTVLTRALDASPSPVPREQERLEVDPSAGAAKRTAAKTTGARRKPATSGKTPKRAPKKR